MMRKIIVFARLPLSIKVIILKCFILLTFCQYSVTFLHFKQLIRLFKLQPCTEQLKTYSTTEETYTKMVSGAISKTLLMPQLIKPRCLAQALTARILLHQKGQSCILTIGAAIEGPGMVAHSWLRCGDIIVTGQHGQEKYREIVSYC